jgi:hypothetical protein
MKYTKEQIAEAKEWFTLNCPKGSTLYTICESVSRSGMSRKIRLVVLKADKETGKIYTLHPNYSASVLLDKKAPKNSEGISVGGCGMDMGFHLVYSLASAIYGDGYALEHSWL